MPLHIIAFKSQTILFPSIFHLHSPSIHLISSRSYTWTFHSISLFHIIPSYISLFINHFILFHSHFHFFTYLFYHISFHYISYVISITFSCHHISIPPYFISLHIICHFNHIFIYSTTFHSITFILPSHIFITSSITYHLF